MTDERHHGAAGTLRSITVHAVGSIRARGVFRFIYKPRRTYVHNCFQTFQHASDHNIR